MLVKGHGESPVLRKPELDAFLGDHSYITLSLVGGEGGQKMPIFDYFQY